MTAAAPAVECRDITVRFGRVTALDGVSLSIPVGGVHAIVGQNGAGKTTLARVIAGLQPAEHGRISVAGNELGNGDHVAARRAGVEMVHQHSSLVPALTVAEALEVGARGGRRRFFRRRSIESFWRQRLLEEGVDVPLGIKVAALSVEAEQAVEIARANPGPGGLLILDEPTASLSPPAIERLVRRVTELRSRGVTTVVVLHKLSEVRLMADAVTVLRGGRIVLDPTPIGAIDDNDLSSLIIGSSAPDDVAGIEAVDLLGGEGRQRARVSGLAQAAAAGTASARGAVCPRELRLHGVHTTPTGADHPLDALDLAVAGGEIVGIAGVEGNGQRSLVEIAVGLGTLHRGRVELFGEDVTRAGVDARRRLGLRAVPFDRNTEGVAGELPLWMNVTAWAASEHRLRRGPMISVDSMRRTARARLEQFGVSYSDLDQPAASLSGGNAQRLILCRELPGAAALVIAQPTRGLDIGGSRFVWDTVHELAGSGVPVLVVSSDLDELLGHADRISVIRRGRIVAEHHRDFDRHEIGRSMVAAGQVVS